MRGRETRTRKPSERVLEATRAPADDDAKVAERRATTRGKENGRKKKSPTAAAKNAGRGTRASGRGEAVRETTTTDIGAARARADVSDAFRLGEVGSPKFMLDAYGETANADVETDTIVPSTIFDDPLLEELSFDERPIANVSLAMDGMSPKRRTNRLTVTLPGEHALEPEFDGVCERSPLMMRRASNFMAEPRRKTLTELVSPRRTLVMGASETSKRMGEFKASDLDSALHNPEEEAKQALSRSQSNASMNRSDASKNTKRKRSSRDGSKADDASADAKLGDAPDGATDGLSSAPFFKVNNIRDGKRETLTRQLSKGLSCEKFI